MIKTNEEIVEIDECDVEDRMQNFGELLDKITDLDDKKKKLWKEIYQNAITDRHNAFIMFKQLAVITKDKSSEHAIHGRNLTSFLERMSKANDQLIKLAELVSRAETGSDAIDPDDVYKKIGHGSKNSR